MEQFMGIGLATWLKLKFKLPIFIGVQEHFDIPVITTYMR